LNSVFPNAGAHALSKPFASAYSGLPAGCVPRETCLDNIFQSGKLLAKIRTIRKNRCAGAQQAVHNSPRRQGSGVKQRKSVTKISIWRLRQTAAYCIICKAEFRESLQNLPLVPQGSVSNKRIRPAIDGSESCGEGQSKQHHVSSGLIDAQISTEDRMNGEISALKERTATGIIACEQVLAPERIARIAR